MHMIRQSMLALGVVALGAVAARSADDEKIVAKEDAIQVVLLRHTSVQKDLHLTAEEVKKIHEFADGQWKKVQDMKGLSEAEKNEKYEAMARQNEKFLHDTLSAEQCKRLNQITMQVAGLLWVARSDVAAELKLTDEQKQKVKEAHKEAHREMQEALSSKGGEIAPEKVRELRMSNRRRLMSILTDEQKGKWKEMAGEPFKGELRVRPAK